MTYDENLSRIAYQKRLTAEDLAARTGIAKARIEGYMEGKTMPAPTKLLALADALEVSPAEITGEEGDFLPRGGYKAFK